MCDDIRVDPSQNNFYFIELNKGPGLRMHRHPTAYLDKEGKNVPIPLPEPRIITKGATAEELSHLPPSRRVAAAIYDEILRRREALIPVFANTHSD